MNKRIIILIGIIIIIILMGYSLVFIKWTDKSNRNEVDKALSIKDLYKNPIEYLNKTINLTGKIWKLDPYNFHTGIKYFQGQIKREYLFTPPVNESWIIYSNNTYFINIFRVPDLFIFPFNPLFYDNYLFFRDLHMLQYVLL